MSNTQITPEEQAMIDKLASACENSASKGFLAQCKAANVPNARAIELHDLYIVQREKRAAKYEEMRAAILGDQASA